MRIYFGFSLWQISNRLSCHSMKLSISAKKKRNSSWGSAPISWEAVMPTPCVCCIAQFAAKIDTWVHDSAMVVTTSNTMLSHVYRNFTQSTGIMYTHSQQQKEAWAGTENWTNQDLQLRLGQTQTRIPYGSNTLERQAAWTRHWHSSKLRAPLCTIIELHKKACWLGQVIVQQRQVNQRKLRCQTQKKETFFQNTIKPVSPDCKIHSHQETKNTAFSRRSGAFRKMGRHHHRALLHFWRYVAHCSFLL